jgi:hypothetical protein
MSWVELELSQTDRNRGHPPSIISAILLSAPGIHVTSITPSTRSCCRLARAMGRGAPTWAVLGRLCSRGAADKEGTSAQGVRAMTRGDGRDVSPDAQPCPCPAQLASRTTPPGLSGLNYIAVRAGRRPFGWCDVSQPHDGALASIDAGVLDSTPIPMSVFNVHTTLGLGVAPIRVPCQDAPQDTAAKAENGTIDLGDGRVDDGMDHTKQAQIIPAPETANPCQARGEMSTSPCFISISRGIPCRGPTWHHHMLWCLTRQP